MISDASSHRRRLLATCHAQTLMRRAEVLDGADQGHPMLQGQRAVLDVDDVALCVALDDLRDAEVAPGPHKRTSPRLSVELPAGDHWKLELGRDPHRIIEEAVDPIADQDPVFIRLDMDVRGAFVDGLDEDIVDQPDDWREIDLPLQLEQIEGTLLTPSRRANRDGIVLLDDPVKAPLRR